MSLSGGYLLDSNIVYWALVDIRRLSPDTIKLLENTEENIFYSIITPWELSIKLMKGKITLPKDFFSSLPAIGFENLPIEETHIDTLRTLPPIHSDPFDRMLVAQAKAERMTLITSDKSLAAYPIKTLLVGA